MKAIPTLLPCKPFRLFSSNSFHYKSLLLLYIVFISCASSPEPPKDGKAGSGSGSISKSDSAGTEPGGPIADAATILARREIPILCYHQVRDYKATDSKMARDYIVPPSVFAEQMKALADSGYQTILPEELYAYLAYGKTLPPKPVMLTFDDTDLEQFTVAAPEMKKHGYKGVFFIMTVSIGRPHYMNKEQIKQLSDEGHAIGSHTWDHHNVKKYSEADWTIQVEKPTKQLEAITGKKINFFAYPFGLWNPEAIPELKKRGMVAAFQLYAKRDEKDPLFTIRRIIITGTNSGASMLSKMRNSFK